MNAVVNALNLIKLAAISNNDGCTVKLNERVKYFLNTLVNLNLIEYTSIQGNLGLVRLKYKDGAPVIKDIKYLGGRGSVTLPWVGLKKILYSRRAVYLVETGAGIVSINTAVAKNQGGLVLFRITI